jgi:hypothetical protein
MSTAVTNNKLLNRAIVSQIAWGSVVISIPICAWWYQSVQNRNRRLHEFEAQIAEKERFPQPQLAQDTYDYIISEKIQPGDVILFERRCENCVTPWSALACLASKYCLTNLNDKNDVGSIDQGRYHHIGLVVPGYKDSQRPFAPNTNLLLLEATPSGIVARDLKQRFLFSTSNILLLQLACPGEVRNKPIGQEDDEEEETAVTKSVNRTRDFVHRELEIFRDKWIAAGENNHYARLHSTATIGGALAYAVGLAGWIAKNAPTSPSAYLVLSGLQKAAAAPVSHEVDDKSVTPEHFLRDYRFSETHAVRLRPGWRFLAPIPIKQSSATG